MMNTARVRFRNIISRCSGPTRWLVACLARRNSAAAVLMQPPRGVCFGPLDEGQQLALRGLAAGGDPSARGPIGERSEQLGTEPSA
jgi:hypothetical protein